MASGLTATLHRLNLYIAAFLAPPRHKSSAPIPTASSSFPYKTRIRKMHHQPHSPFFHLPGEVRDLIYRHYLNFTWDQFADAKGAGPMSLECFDKPYSAPLPNLMLACKRLYRELAPRALRQAEFVMCHVEYVCWWGMSTSCGLAAYGPLRLAELRRLVVVLNSRVAPPATGGIWGRYLPGLLERTPLLRELVFELFTSPDDWGLWSREQETEVVPYLKMLPRLEVVRFRGYVPDQLVELVAAETNIKVLRSELNDCWPDRSLLDPDENRFSWAYSQ